MSNGDRSQAEEKDEYSYVPSFKKHCACCKTRRKDLEERDKTIAELNRRLDAAQAAKHELDTLVEMLRKELQSEKDSHELAVRTADARWREQLEQYREAARSEIMRTATAVRELQQKVTMMLVSP